MAKRPRHPNKHIEEVIKTCEAQGWTFTKGKKYFKGRCPCGIHTKTVHMTPNDSYHGNLKRFIERLECWNQGR